MNGSVCAVVVTYNRKETLRGCLRSLLAQTRPPDAILVVDNASTDGTPTLVAGEFPGVQVLVLADNRGGAGGFDAGMKLAHDRGHDHLWIMDDDAEPEPGCLAALLAVRGAHVAVPLQLDRTGRLYGASRWRGRAVDVSAELEAPAAIDLFAFVGPLVSREAVDRAGLPNPEFFIYFDDWHYSLRLRQLGLRVVAVPDAVVRHDYGVVTRPRRAGRLLSGARARQPAWKTYYDTRNYLHALRDASPDARSLAWYTLLQARRALGDLAYEPDRWVRVRLRWRGLVDGLAGRLGKLVDPKPPYPYRRERAGPTVVARTSIEGTEVSG